MSNSSKCRVKTIDARKANSILIMAYFATASREEKSSLIHALMENKDKSSVYLDFCLGSRTHTSYSSNFFSALGMPLFDRDYYLNPMLELARLLRDKDVLKGFTCLSSNDSISMILRTGGAVIIPEVQTIKDILDNCYVVMNKSKMKELFGDEATCRAMMGIIKESGRDVDFLEPAVNDEYALYEVLES